MDIILEHGKFTINPNNVVVHTYLSDVFNEHGIVDYRETLLDMVRSKPAGYFINMLMKRQDLLLLF